MKTLFYPDYGKLVIDERPVPDINDTDVLMEIKACGICGSELESFGKKSKKRTPPIIMGHEFSGVIHKTGKDVTGFSVGQRVVSNSVIHCGKCSACRVGDTNLCKNRKVFGINRDGAFAEYINVPVHCLTEMPPNLSFEEACMAEPLGNGIHMVKLTQHIRCERVLIIGAGPIGLMAQQAFQAIRNCDVMVADIKPGRLEVAKKLGAWQCIDPATQNLEKAVSRLTDDNGVDIVIDAVGMHTTQRQSIASLRPGGAMVIIGLFENTNSITSYEIILPEKQVLGTYAATMEDIADALQIMGEKKVDVTSWIDYYPLTKGVEAFMDMLAARDRHIKSVILP